jgi:hypothetical protein
MIDVAREFERLRDYLVGRLPDDEVRDFEDRLVRDPELAREFEQSLRLHAGMQELRAQGYFAVRTSRPSRLRMQLADRAVAVDADPYRHRAHLHGCTRYTRSRRREASRGSL